MIEAFIVLGAIAALVAVGLALTVLEPAWLLIVGLGCIAGGFVVGVPAGAYYHLVLYRCLRELGEVPRSFWLYPTRYHHHLSPPQWRAVSRWFVLGAAGFGLIVLGCVVLALGVWRAR